MLNLPIQTSFYGFCLCQSSFTTDLYLLQKPTAESKAPCLKDQPDPPPIPSPIVCHCPKVRVTPEVHGELSNPREEERSLRVHWIPLPPMVMLSTGLAGRTSPTKAPDYGKVVMPWSIWEA